MKRLAAAMIISLIFSICMIDYSDFTKTRNSLEEGVLRLHILANSDSEEDQQLKLKVRDAILEECPYLFVNADTPDEMMKTAEENSDRIKSVAERVISENGKNYDVKCEVVNMHFDTRVYDEITMPEGDYNAVRITIGEALGRNWWCVMYPPLCVPPASDPTELSEYFSESEVDMLTKPVKYEAKFKCAELLEELSEMLTRE